MFDRFTTTLIQAINNRPSETAPKPANTNANRSQSRACTFCADPGHFMDNCHLVGQYLAQGKVQRDINHRLILSSGAEIPRLLPGICLRNKVDEWHSRNPGQTAKVEIAKKDNTSAQSLVYGIAPPTAAAYHLSKDDEIAALRAEVFTLRNQQVFDGVHMPPRKYGPPNRRAEPPKVVPTPAPDPVQLPVTRPVEPASVVTAPKPTSEPVHPFRNVRETAYLPPHERNFGGLPPKQDKNRDLAYRTHAPVKNPNTVEAVFKRSMETPFVTLSQSELLSLSADCRQKMRESVTPKRSPPKDVKIQMIDDDDSENYLPFSEPLVSVTAQDIVSSSDAIIVPDPYELYLTSLKQGEIPEVLTIAQKSPTRSDRSL